MARPPPRSTLFPYTTLFRSTVGRPLTFAAFTTARSDDGSRPTMVDRKSTRLNSSHTVISYAVFCLKKKKDLLLDAQLPFIPNKLNTQLRPGLPYRSSRHAQM